MTDFFDKEDKTLVELTLLGNKEAYGELVVRHERAVKGTAYKVTHNSYSAEDASQDAFVCAWMNLSSLRAPERFGAWVCSIAKNCARSLVTHYSSTLPDISFELLENTELDGCEDSTISDLIARGESEKLRAAVNALSEKIRAAIVMHYFEDLSVKDIASRLSISEGTVKWRLSEGRKQLRKGYGIMEKKYNENEPMLTRVMRQVEELKLWRVREDKTGFEEEYRYVLGAVEALEDSKEKSHALADTLQMGYWWLPGEKNDETFERIRKAAIEGENDDVMPMIVRERWENLNDEDTIKAMLETIAEFDSQKYPKTVAYIWFWLGRNYIYKNKPDFALEAFEKVLSIVPPSNVYYANAKAAIILTEKLLQEANPNMIGYDVCGEVYRYIGGKLYFWTQPGFSCHRIIGDSLFWNISAADKIIIDPTQKVGEVRACNCGSTLYVCDDASIDTPAGHFDGCSVYRFEGNKYGLTFAETYICSGVGIVYQRSVRNGEVGEWALSAYKLNGGEGAIPFAVGNRWEYQPLTKDEDIECEAENVFEITAYENGSATVLNASTSWEKAYRDTWRGKILEAREQYCDDKLFDVSAALARAAELAVTKREKVHTEIATDVMKRIFATDEEYNPDYTEAGRWNFFEYDMLERKDGKVCQHDNRTYSFEWKNTKECGSEGYKVLYSFMYTILENAMGCLWSDEWCDGYGFDELKNVNLGTVKDFRAVGGESVTTPAGTFEDCMHISFDYAEHRNGYFKGKSDYWFAPSVGIVKFEHPFWGENLAVWQLTDYRGTGTGYFPTDDGMFRRYEPDALGDGWHGSLEYTFDTDNSGTVMFKNALGTQDRANFDAAMKKE